MPTLTRIPGQQHCPADRRDPLDQTHLQITLEDDGATWRRVCPCGKPCGNATPMTVRELEMFPALVSRARRYALTTFTLAIVDFKEVAR